MKTQILTLLLLHLLTPTPQKTHNIDKILQTSIQDDICELNYDFEKFKTQKIENSQNSYGKSSELETTFRFNFPNGKEFKTRIVKIINEKNTEPFEGIEFYNFIWERGDFLIRVAMCHFSKVYDTSKKLKLNGSSFTDINQNLNYSAIIFETNKAWMLFVKTKQCFSLDESVAFFIGEVFEDKNEFFLAYPAFKEFHYDDLLRALDYHSEHLEVDFFSDDKICVLQYRHETQVMNVQQKMTFGMKFFYLIKLNPEVVLQNNLKLFNFEDTFWRLSDESKILKFEVFLKNYITKFLEIFEKSGFSPNGTIDHSFLINFETFEIYFLQLKDDDSSDIDMVLKHFNLYKLFQKIYMMIKFKGKFSDYLKVRSSNINNYPELRKDIDLNYFLSKDKNFSFGTPLSFEGVFNLVMHEQTLIDQENENLKKKEKSSDEYSERNSDKQILDDLEKNFDQEDDLLDNDDETENFKDERFFFIFEKEFNTFFFNFIKYNFVIRKKNINDIFTKGSWVKFYYIIGKLFSSIGTKEEYEFFDKIYDFLVKKNEKFQSILSRSSNQKNSEEEKDLKKKKFINKKILSFKNRTKIDLDEAKKINTINALLKTNYEYQIQSQLKFPIDKTEEIKNTALKNTKEEKLSNEKESILHNVSEIVNFEINKRKNNSLKKKNKIGKIYYNEHRNHTDEEIDSENEEDNIDPSENIRNIEEQIINSEKFNLFLSRKGLIKMKKKKRDLNIQEEFFKKLVFSFFCFFLLI